jgi:predicted PurR-regulated permease PerM
VSEIHHDKSLGGAHHAAPPDTRAHLALSPAVTVAIVGTFLILLFGALFYARGFFLPLVLAVLVTLTFAPFVRVLSHRGVPAAVSAVMLVIVLGGGIAGGATLLSQPVSQMITQAPTLVTQVRERFAFLRQPLATLSEAGRQIQAITSGGDQTDEPQRVVLAESGLLAWVAGTAADFGTTFGAMLILSLFLLASGDTLRAKLIRVVPNLSDKKRSLRVLRDIENEVSRYLLIITAINAGFGLCVGIAMAVLGMPNPLLWGVAAGLLNFIPYLGGFVGNTLATVIAIVTFPTLTQAALVPLAYLGIQLVESNFVTPVIVGRRLELNTVAILIFLSLTTWMWGIVGTIIGVPLLVVIKVFSDNFPNLSSLGEFLSAESRIVEEPESEHSGAIPVIERAPVIEPIKGDTP